MNAVRRAHNVMHTDCIDLKTSYDGSWQTRGNKSNNGLGCVIENETGLCVDFHTMTRFCQLCATTGEKLKKEDPEAYREWWDRHKSSCHINHTGSAGSMEKAAAVEMWGRSMEMNQARYVSMTSDGDTNTIEALHECNPYPGVKVKKDECINHVAKRMGTRLKTLVDT